MTKNIIKQQPKRMFFSDFSFHTRPCWLSPLLGLFFRLRLSYFCLITDTSAYSDTQSEEIQHLYCSYAKSQKNMNTSKLEQRKPNHYKKKKKPTCLEVQNTAVKVEAGTDPNTASQAAYECIYLPLQTDTLLTGRFNFSVTRQTPEVSGDLSTQTLTTNPEQ